MLTCSKRVIACVCRTCVHRKRGQGVHAHRCARHVVPCIVQRAHIAACIHIHVHRCTHRGMQRAFVAYSHPFRQGMTVDTSAPAQHNRMRSPPHTHTSTPTVTDKQHSLCTRCSGPSAFESHLTLHRCSSAPQPCRRHRPGATSVRTAIVNHVCNTCACHSPDMGAPPPPPPPPPPLHPLSLR